MNDQQIRELVEKHVTFEPVGSPDHLYVCIGEFVAADVKLCNKARGEQIVKFIREQMEAAIREAISLTRNETIEECAKLVSGYHGEVGTVGYKFATTQDLAADIRAMAVRS